jgi:TPP-dependent indolepyruvate ferredoxin oxidoreductase alpha subunit
MRLRLEHPLADWTLLELASQVRELLVLEECTPTLETAVRARLHAAGLTTKVIGRSDLGDARPIGRLSGASLERVLDIAAPLWKRPRELAVEFSPRRDHTFEQQLADLPAELLAREQAFEQAHPLPGFPASDPRGPLFDHLRELGRLLGKVCFIATDPGVTGLLALADQRSDVKMHMGGAVPIAAGWSRGCPDGLAIAVVGDTNLPHSEWLGLIDAVDHRDDLLVVMADNGSSEMTQRIVTPRASPERALASFAAIGVRCWSARASLDVTDPWAGVLAEAAAETGVRLVWIDLS